MTPPTRRARLLLSRMLAKMRQAERELSLPLAGRRILVGMSGGWDSYALLLVLKEYRRVVKHTPALHAAYAAFQGAAALPPSAAFLDYMASLGIPLLPLAATRSADSCQICRLKRREVLLKCAKHMKCDVIVLGHHLEDFAETLLLNMMYAGNSEGLFPQLRYFDRYSVVRPLALVTKAEIMALGQAFSFPPTHPPCPVYRTSHRDIIREFLKERAQGNKHVLRNLVRVGLKTCAQSREQTSREGQ